MATQFEIADYMNVPGRTTKDCVQAFNVTRQYVNDAVMRKFYREPERYTLARKNVRGSRERNYEPQCALGLLIDEAIQEKHLCFAEAVRLSCCSSSQLASYKAGRLRPQLITLVKLCGGLGINFEEAVKALKKDMEVETDAQ